MFAFLVGTMLLQSVGAIIYTAPVVNTKSTVATLLQSAVLLSMLPSPRSDKRLVVNLFSTKAYMIFLSRESRPKLEPEGGFRRIIICYRGE